MRVRKLIAVLAVLPLAAVTVAAGDDGCRTVDPDGVADTGDEYVLCEVQTWFHAADAKVQNASYVNEDAVPLPSWDENPPAGSVSGGNGGGFAASAQGDTTSGRLHATFEGTFTGELDVLDVDLHLLYGLFAVYRPDDIQMTVYVDEFPVFSGTGIAVRTTADTANTPVTFKQEFALVGIRDSLKSYGLPTDGEHTVRIEVRPHFLDSGNWAYVFDTTEVPSGILFNPETITPGTTILNTW